MYLLESKLKTQKLTPQEKINSIAAIFYGKDITTNLTLVLDRKEFMKFLGEAKRNCYTTLIKLKVEGKEYDVVIKDIQWHKLTTQPEHVDFYSIKKLPEIQVKYNIQYVHEDVCLGVKNGGKLHINYKQVKGSVNPYKMTPNLKIDLKNLKINEKINTDFLEETYKDMHLKVNQKAVLVYVTGK